MDRRVIPVFELSEYRLPASDLSGFSIETLASSLLNHPYRSRPHYHHFFQVFLTFGSGSLMHDFVDYSISGPVLTFTSPGQVHTVLGAVTGSFISFSQEFFDGDTPPPSKLLEYPFFFAPTAPPFLKLRDGDIDWCKKLFAELQREYQTGQPGAQEILRAYLRILFTRIARLYPPPAYGASGSGASSRPAQLVLEFRLAVENRFRELTALPAYAALLKVTANHLNDTVRKETGQSAGEIIRQRLLLEAKRLLLHSDLSVSEISYELRFKDPSYFSRFFRRRSGHAPAAFRNKIREKYQESTS